ncbi:MAG: TonB-dependent receptor [Acidobacteria bacterium]|nr:TonB-dependent receptor [Acidobacteriota bacterium]
MPIRTVMAALLSLLLIPPSANAQVFTGSIHGAVHDASGAPAVGTTVTVINADTGYRRSEMTNDAGNFLFGSLPAGNYELTAEAAGFKQEAVKGIVLSTNQKVEVNFDLKLGEVSEKVEVTGTAALMNTSDYAVAQVIDQKKILDLPLNGRNFVQLARLSAGVEQRAINRGLMSVNGTRGNSSSFLFDGVDSTDQNAIFQPLMPSIDAIAEFNIQTSNYSAEFGRSAGGQVNLVSKGGTNQFHGSAFEFLRNSALDAKDFFAPATQRIPPFKRNQFGAVVSGPVIRNRTFFMGNYEGGRIRQSITALASVPTPAQRTGDFSQTLNAAGAVIPLRDPTTNQAFPGNRIPAGRLDPTGSKILALYPLPNRVGTQNLVSSPGNPIDSNLGAVRIDHRFSDKDTAFGRYFRSTSTEVNPFGVIAGAANLGTTVPGFGITFPNTGQNVSLNWTRVLSPTMVMESRAGLLRFYTARWQNGDVDGLGQLGIEGGSAAPNTFGYPLMAIPGYGTLGHPANTPQFRYCNTFHYFWSLSRITGKHTLKVGMEARRAQQNLTLSNVVRGNFTFSTTFTGISIGDVLLGQPLLVTKIPTPLISGMRQTTTGTYIQDDWKVTRRLTINLGMRFEYFQPLLDKYDNARLFDPSDRTVKRVGTNGMPRAGYGTDKNNFAPRAGFAFTPFANSKTVLRGGYGIFYDYENWNSFIVTMQAAVLQYNSPGTISRAMLSSAAAQPPAPYSIQRNFPIAYYQSWNLMLERMLPGGILAGAGYVATKGSHIPITLDTNQAIPGPGTPQSRRPLTQFGAINTLRPSQSSIYHSLQMRAEKRFSRGLALLLNYTFSKAIDYGLQDIAALQNAYDLRAERGLSNTDSRHKFNGNFTYELPFGKGQRYLSSLSRVPQAMLGGWQFNGIVSLLSGLPFNPVVSTDTAGIGRTGQRPNRLENGAIPDGTPERWYNRAAFVRAAAGTFGNSGRNVLTGPGLENADLSMFKEFTLTEKSKLQFRTEFFNATNTPHWGQPAAIVDTANAGTISQTIQSNRQIQFALKFLF